MIIASPIVIDLGVAREMDIKELLHGTGKLLEEVEQVMRLVRERTAQESSKGVLIPVVAVYTKAEHPDTREDVLLNFRAPRERKRARRNIAWKLRQ